MTLSTGNREIVIHIGLPKTATTSIQDALYLNSGLLKSNHGIDYCVDLCSIGRARGTGHHVLAWGKFVKNHPHYRELDDQIIKHRLENQSKILLSSEWFTYATTGILRDLINQWGIPSKRKVLLVQRNELDFVRSRWMQCIKMGNSFLSLTEFYFQRYKPRRKTISELLDPWLSNGFTPTVMSFDDLVNSKKDVCKKIIEDLYNLTIDDQLWQTINASNISPKVATVEKYRQLLCFLSDELELGITDGSTLNASQYHNLHDHVCNRLLNQSYDSADEDHILKDLQALAKIKLNASRYNKLHDYVRNLLNQSYDSTDEDPILNDLQTLTKMNDL